MKRPFKTTICKLGYSLVPLFSEQAVYLQSIRSPLVPLDQLLAGQNPNLELGNVRLVISLISFIYSRKYLNEMVCIFQQDDDEIGVRKKRKLRVIESDSDDD